MSNRDEILEIDMISYIIYNIVFQWYNEFKNYTMDSFIEIEQQCDWFIRQVHQLQNKKHFVKRLTLQCIDVFNN